MRHLRAKGIPVDGVGHQMHSTLGSPSTQAIADTIGMFSALGVENQITELDMSLYSDRVSQELRHTRHLLLEQGYRYRDFFRTFRELKGKITSATFWGIADDHTWLKRFPIARRDLPLLFDERLQTKYAYWGIVNPARLPKQKAAGK